MNLVRNHRTRRAATAGVTLVMAAVLGTAGATASNAETAAPQTQQTQQIASSVLGSDYKITLTALRSSEDQYAASVQLKVYTHNSGTWKESDRVTVGNVDGWFWYPLTGSHAVCQFTTASTEPAPVDVSLTITPSIGCSQPAHYVVKQGKVYTG